MQPLSWWLRGFCAKDAVAALSASTPPNPSAAASFVINVFIVDLHFLQMRIGTPALNRPTERPAVSHEREIWLPRALITGTVANGLFATIK